MKWIILNCGYELKWGYNIISLVDSFIMEAFEPTNDKLSESKNNGMKDEFFIRVKEDTGIISQCRKHLIVV